MVVSRSNKGRIALSLEQRITRLEDLEKIKTVKAKYAQFLDDGFNPEGIASVFAEDGRWIIEDTVIEGTQAIKEQCRGLVKVQPWSCHNVTPSVIEIAEDGDTAVGTFYILTFLTMRDSKGNEGAYFLPGVFYDKFVKKGEDWYIQEAKADVRQAAPWTEGWVKGNFKQGFFDF